MNADRMRWGQPTTGGSVAPPRVRHRPIAYGVVLQPGIWRLIASVHHFLKRAARPAAGGV